MMMDRRIQAGGAARMRPANMTTLDAGANRSHVVERSRDGRRGHGGVICARAVFPVRVGTASMGLAWDRPVSYARPAARTRRGLSDHRRSMGLRLFSGVLLSAG